MSGRLASLLTMRCTLGMAAALLSLGRSDDLSAAWVLEERLNHPMLMAHVEQMLVQIAAKQLQPFKGVSEAQLNLPYFWDSDLGHGLLRVRILGGRMFVQKLFGTRLRGEVWSDRHLSYLEGLLSLLETEQVPDVDFVVSLLDHPLCEAKGMDTPMPVFVFAKKPGCQNILVPDHSLMHDEYQHSAIASNFHWSAIVGKAMTHRWQTRRHGILWEGDFVKQHRLGLKALRHFLNVSSENSERHWNMDFYTSPSGHCSYQKSLHAQGVSWSMRLKNIFMCATVAVWYRPPPEHTYHEYWYDFLEDGKHFLGIQEASPVQDMERVLQFTDTKLRLIAQRGFNYTAAILRPASVRRYLAILLRSYASLQKFTPADLHKTAAMDFKEITPSTLRAVRAHASALSTQHFHFYYSDRADWEDGLQRALDARSLHELPCWGPFRQMVKCCTPSNRWKYMMTTSEELWGDLHPFCVALGENPHLVWGSCCNRTLVNITQIFRLARDRHHPTQFLENLDLALLELDLSLHQAEELVKLARDASLHAVMNIDLPNKAALGSASSGNHFSDTEIENQLSRAWFYEELLKLICTAQCLSLGSHSCSDDQCSDVSILELLTRKRSQQRASARLWRQSFRLTAKAQVQQAEAVDIMLLFSDQSNELALTSMLENRACPLRLHILAPRPVSTEWVDQLLLTRQITDVTAERHLPQDEADLLSEHLPFCASDGSTYKCEVVFAALLPHLWIAGHRLPFFDLSDPARGPFIPGDVCRLCFDYSSIIDGAILGAPPHLEYSRWGYTNLSADVLLFNLDSMRKSDLSALFGQLSQKEYSNDGLTPVQVLRNVLSTWVQVLHDMQQVTILPPSWWFVPLEPWLYDMGWDVLMGSSPWVRDTWLPVFRMREYLGFDGSIQGLKVYCPPPASFIPAAIQELWPDFQQRHLYALAWSTRIGKNSCNSPVHVVSLQWERADRPPRIPIGIRDLPWMATWLKSYKRFI